MIRINRQFLGALCVFGCGTGAYATPSHQGQWLDGYQTQNPTTYDHGQGPPGQTTPSFSGDPGQTDDDCPPEHSQPCRPGDDHHDRGLQDEDSTAHGQRPDPWDDDPRAQAEPDDDADDQDVDDRDADGHRDRTFTPPGQARLGVMVMAMTPELRQSMGAPQGRGVLVAKVEPGSAAARAGIRAGDVLVRVGSTPVRSRGDVVQALAAHPGRVDPGRGDPSGPHRPAPGAAVRPADTHAARARRARRP
jgi:hypothetical protein